MEDKVEKDKWEEECLEITQHHPSGSHLILKSPSKAYLGCAVPRSLRLHPGAPMAI